MPILGPEKGQRVKIPAGRLGGPYADKGRAGVIVRSLGMLAYVLWDGDTEEVSINGYYLDKEEDEVQ